MKKAAGKSKIVKHKGAGHRGRLRERFLQGGLDALLDYEIIELLLTLGTPMKDCKDMAKAAIKEFKGLRNVLDATIDELQVTKGIGPSNAFGIKLFQAISERYAKEHLPEKIALKSPREVADYLRERIGREKKEYFVVVSFDTRNNVIGIDTVSVGILNANLVHPRETFEVAIRHHAAKIVIAHNHPSDDSEASPEDVAMTRRLGDAAKILGIELLDHIIVTKNNFSSLREQGLIN